MATSNEPDTGKKVLRILVPITADDDSRWGITYALRRHAARQPLEVCLLNVGEFIDQWEVLRFRTQTEIAAFQSERAQAFIDEARLPLIAEEIPCRGLFKQGDVVFSILDTAEELECDEIVVPRPASGLFRFLGRDIVRTVVRHRRDIPIIVVDADGLVVTETVS